MLTRFVEMFLAPLRQKLLKNGSVPKDMQQLFDAGRKQFTELLKKYLLLLKKRSPLMPPLPLLLKNLLKK